MCRKCRIFVPLFLLLIVLVAYLPVTATAQDTPGKDDLKFYVALYGWMPNIYGESGTDSDFEIDLDDILDDLQFMVMANVGVKKDKWEVYADVIYMDLEADNNSIGRLKGVVPVNVDTDVELNAWVVTPKVTYNLIEKDKFKMNILAGARYLYLDVDLKVDIDDVRDHGISGSGSVSDNWWDAVVGITGEVTLNEKWFMPYYFDIGTGQMELTFNLFGGIGYRFNRVDLEAGWRYMRWNFDDNPALDNLYISGPIVGFRYRF